MAHFTLHTLLVICVAASLFIWSRRPRASGKVALWIGALLLAALLVEIAGRLLPLSGRINAPVYNLLPCWNSHWCFASLALFGPAIRGGLPAASYSARA